MEIKMAGNQFMQNLRADLAGTYQIVYDVTTPSGKSGTALFVYEYDKRDVIDEAIITTPEIASELQEYIGDDSPSAFKAFAFPNEGEKNKNAEKVAEAIKACTENVYGW